VRSTRCNGLPPDCRHQELQQERTVNLRLVNHPAACLVLAVAAACSAARADVGRTPLGVWYWVGGIGEEEESRLAIDSLAHAFSLRLAARGSGAYLADVDLRIIDADDRTVFQGHLDGPWLLMDLPPGRYEIVGEHDGEVSRLKVVVPEHGRRSAVMYFPVAGEVRPFREEQP